MERGIVWGAGEGLRQGTREEADPALPGRGQRVPTHGTHIQCPQYDTTGQSKQSEHIQVSIKKYEGFCQSYVI